MTDHIPDTGKMAPDPGQCQHDHMKPNPSLRATYPRHGSSEGWVQEYRCNVCQCSFEKPMATAGFAPNGRASDV